MTHGEELITVAEAARRSGYSVRHLQSLLKRGVIPGRKLARDWLLTWEAVAAYKAKDVKPGPKPRSRRQSD